MDALQTVEKYDQEILKVSNCAKVLILPGPKICINISTAGTIFNRHLTVWGPKGGYYGAFPVSLHLVTFLLTYDKLFLIVEYSLPQPESKMHLVIYIMNALLLS